MIRRSLAYDSIEDQSFPELYFSKARRIYPPWSHAADSNKYFLYNILSLDDCNMAANRYFVRRLERQWIFTRTSPDGLNMFCMDCRTTRHCRHSDKYVIYLALLPIFYVFDVLSFRYYVSLCFRI
jgi:hypothetical protein